MDASLAEGPVGIHAEAIIAVVGGSGDRSKLGHRIPRYLRCL
jgi:predicted CoA-binding protein